MAELIQRLDHLVRMSVAEARGEVFKATGDGHFAVFESPRSAISCAQAIRNEVATWRIADEKVGLRLVIHKGDAELQNGDYFGPPLNLLGRLLKASHGNQIVASGSVAVDSNDIEFARLGSFLVSGFDDPIPMLELAPMGSPIPPKLTDWNDVFKSIPVERTSLIGREDELRAIRASLESKRLTTLVGPGGVGKTRLAVRTAHRSIGQFAKGIWMIQLVHLRPGDDLLAELERVLGCTLKNAEDGFRFFAEKLDGEPALLILDNAEHVLAQVSDLLRQLDSNVPSLRLLATSREPLGWPGEGVVTIAPMNPERSDPFDLFNDRVRDFRPEWSPTPDERKLIEQICRHVDGIPFAIELAAARFRTMALTDLLSALEESLSSVGAGFRGIGDRRESLAEVVKWSVDLLTEEERQGLIHLSIAEPGFDLKAARAICGLKAGQVAPIVDGLVSKNLLVFDDRSATYSMLQITREVAASLFDSSDEKIRVSNRHCLEFLSRVIPQLDNLRGEKQGATLVQWDLERANILAALEHGSRTPELNDLTVHAASVFWRFWSMRGHLSEGVQRLSALVADISGDVAIEHWVSTLRGLAWMHYLKGDIHRAEAVLRSALDSALELDDPRQIAPCHSLLGSLLAWRGQFSDAISEYQLAFEGFQAAEDHANLARTHLHLGDAYLSNLELEQATGHIHAALEGFAALGDHLARAWALYSMGRASDVEGRPEEVVNWYRESLQIRTDRKDGRGIAYAMQALCAADTGSACEGLRLGLDALRMMRDMGDEGGTASAMLAIARRLERLEPALASRFAVSARHLANRIDLAFSRSDQAHLKRIANTSEPPHALDELVAEAISFLDRLT